jgi:hypothetical protein
LIGEQHVGIRRQGSNAVRRSARLMRTWMKAVLLVPLVAGLCWGGAIWFWRATDRMPGTLDLVLSLFVLPLGLLLAIWLGRSALRVAAAAPTSAAPAAAPLAILAAAIRTPHGASPGELTGAIAAGTARARLDKALVDDNGFPVMSLRSDDADDAGLRDEISQWCAPGLALADEQWRALVLATGVAADLAHAAAERLLTQAGEAPLLYLLPILPPAWSIDERRMAGQWLQHVVARAGWPPARMSLAAELPADTRGASPCAVLRRLAHQGILSGQPLVGLIVAGASCVGSATVDQWIGNGTLFDATRPQGLIPGEGAAALLLTDLRQARALDGASYATLHLAPEARRDDSADDANQADATLLVTMVDKLLAAGATRADAVVKVVADTGHRNGRVMELMALAGASLGALDPEADIMRVGGACGASGAASFVAAIALARHHAIGLQAPVLCISNEDPYRRGAVLVRPAAALS